jgi:uncharacterized membrane protein
MIAAILTSVMSVADAALHGLTGHFLLDVDASAPAVIAASNALVAVTFALLTAVVTEQARRIDAGRRPVRWVRRLMQATLAVLTIVFAGGLAVDIAPDTSVLHRIWEAAGGAGFLLMFVVGVILGACLLRRPQLRRAAVLMAAPAAIIPLTLLVAALAPDWAHPAYAESALYIGLALLGYGSSHHDAEPSRPADLNPAQAPL